MDREAEQEPESGEPTGAGRGWTWLWAALLFVLVSVSGGVVGFLAGGEELFTGRWWLVVGGYLLVGGAAGLGAGLLLRRSLAWRSSAWAARRKQLSWRQRLRIGWAFERARGVEDPVLAQAAVERGEFGLQVMSRLEQWYVLAARGLAVLVILMAAGLLVLSVWGWDNRSEDWLVVAMAAGLGVLGAGLPGLYRRMWRWTTRRAEKSLAANRAVAARAGEGES